MSFKDSNLKLAFKNLFLSKRRNEYVLEPHMGLGDSLICLGLVKTLASRHSNAIFYYACLPSYFHSVSWMMKDLTNVFPLAVRSGREARQYAQFKNAKYLSIGVDGVDIRKFDEFFYQQHQVLFELRWGLKKTPAGSYSQDLFKKINPEGRPYILVCKMDSGGHSYQLNLLNGDDLLEIEVKPETNNIFDWADLVLGATEIHTIDTAFIHFVENTLDSSTDKKLYFHRIRQSPTEFTRRLPWKEVLYS
jgi:hypothetical protein